MWPDMLDHAFDPRRQAISEFQDSQGYIVRPCLEKNKKKKNMYVGAYCGGALL